MARFIRHEPCPSCGSRDNLGRWDDGSAYCFGCHYVERRTGVPNFVSTVDGDSVEGGTIHQLPTDVGTSFPEGVVSWLSSFGISVEEVLSIGAVWSSYWEQFIIPYYRQDGSLGCYQARNFNKERAAKAKYYNVGSKEDVLPIWGEKAKLLVITEDALSSLKIARQRAAMPALGTSLSVPKITALRRLGVEQVVVWLDRDKWREARELADKFKWINIGATTVLSDEDPKRYTDEQIKDFLK